MSGRLPSSPPPAPGFPDESWMQFLSARTALPFCTSWLGLLQSRLPTVVRASVLFAGEEGRLMPAASWPAPLKELADWEPIISECLGGPIPQALVRPCGNGSLITQPILIDHKTAALVCVEIADPVAQATPAAREVHWASAWLTQLMAQHRQDANSRRAEQLAAVMDLTALSLREGALRHTLYELLHALREHFACTSVSLGWVRGQRILLAARSDTSSLEKNTPVCAATVAAMEECLDHGRFIDSQSLPDLSAHHALRALLGAGSVASHPLSAGAEIIGVLCFERAETAALPPDQRARLDALAGLLGSVLHQRQQAEASLWRRLTQTTKAALRALFGPHHLVAKCAITVSLLLIAALALIPVEHRVRARTVVEGSVQHTMAAPFQGFIGASHHRAGDTVRSGQLLAALDTRELVLERAKAASTRDQQDLKIRDAMAQHDVANLQVLRAQQAQAAAELALIEEKIQRANVTAPMNGILIFGDWSQQLGSPVEIGQKLFEIAPLTQFRVVLEVDERDIASVREGQSGELLLNGVEGKPLRFAVARITPLASARDGKNLFRVEARLPDEATALLPGMEGVGKIHAGERALGWVLFHPFVEWLSLTLWHFAP